MTSHANIDWEKTRYLNKREYETNLRWTMKHDPEGHMAKNVYSKIATRGSDGSTVIGGGAGMGGKYEGDAFVPIPVALRNDLRRREVSNEANERAKELVSMSPSPQSRNATNPRRSLNDSLPSIQSTAGDSAASPVSRQLLAGTRLSSRGGTADETSAAAASSSASSRHHVRRLHKKNCPKHLMNEMRRRKEAEEAVEKYDEQYEKLRKDGSAADPAAILGSRPTIPYSEVLDGKDAIPCTIGMKRSDILQRESNVDKLIKDTPFLVGRSMAYVFTGSYDPSVNVRKHRMVDEHPDFAKNNAKLDREVARYSRGGHRTAGGLSPTRGGDVNTSPTKKSSTASPPLRNGFEDSISRGYAGCDGSPARKWASTGKDAFLGTTGASGNKSLVRTLTGALDGPDEDEVEMVEHARALELANEKGDRTATDGAHRHLSHTKVSEEKILVDDIHFDHYRRKYEMKTHTEKMRSMGTGLLREFANGKGFK